MGTKREEQHGGSWLLCLLFAVYFLLLIRLILFVAHCLHRCKTTCFNKTLFLQHGEVQLVSPCLCFSICSARHDPGLVVSAAPQKDVQFSAQFVLLVVLPGMLYTRKRWGQGEDKVRTRWEQNEDNVAIKRYFTSNCGVPKKCHDNIPISLDIEIDYV